MAWFRHDDGEGGWNTPILLKSFREIVSGTQLQTQPAEPLRLPEITDALLWQVQQRILDNLDMKLRSAPSASQVFVCFCRDKLTLAKMHRRNQNWSESTIKLRIKSLRAFLKKEFNGLTLESFFVDRSIFSAAERQLADYRAKNTSPCPLASFTAKTEQSNPAIIFQPAVVSLLSRPCPANIPTKPLSLQGLF